MAHSDAVRYLASGRDVVDESPNNMKPSHFAIVALTLLAGCRALTLDYVPKAEHLRQSHSTFMIVESDVQGIYGNMDVDSVIFTYKRSIWDYRG